MKRLLYLLPLLLVGLSATPVTVYKDKVDLLTSKNPNTKIEGALTELSPSHWKMLSLGVSASGNLDSSSVTVTTDDSSSNAQTAQQPKAEPLYKGATFRGFPFAAYFSKSSSVRSGSFNSSLNASGFSWLWAAVDGLFIIVSLVVAFKINHKKKEATPTIQPITPQSIKPTKPPQTHQQI